MMRPVWGDGLVTSEGQAWRWQRHAVAPGQADQDLAAAVIEARVQGMGDRLGLHRVAAAVRTQIEPDLAAVEPVPDPVRVAGVVLPSASPRPMIWPSMLLM